SKNENDAQPHDRRHLVAVPVQLVERGDAARLDIGTYAIDHFVKIMRWDGVAIYGVMKSGPRRVSVESAGQRVGERGSPAIQGLAPGAGLIAQIVAIAHEGVDCAHRIALITREQDERIIK